MNLRKINIKNVTLTEFARNVGTLLTGNIASQIILYSVVPIITRLFRPEEFGVFAIFGALVVLLSRFSAFSYNHAILLPRSNTEALKLFQLAAIIILGFSILLVPFFTWGSQTLDLFSLGKYRSWFALMPVAVALSGYNDLLIGWHIRNKRYRLLGGAKVLDALVSSSVKVLVGIYFGSCVGGLIGGFLGGTLTSLILLGLLLGCHKESKTSKKFNKNGERTITLKDVANRYRKFPLFVTLTQTINIMSQKMVIFVFASFFPANVVGYYNLAQRVASNPTGMLSDAVQKVYYQKSAAEVAHNISILPNLKRLILGLALIGLVPFSILFIAGQPIFSFLFGKEWVSAGLYAQLLAPWLYLKFLTNPARLVFYVRQRQEVLFIMNLVSLCIRAAALIIGALIYRSVIQALLCFVFASSATEIVICYLSLQEAGKPLNLVEETI